MAEKEKDWWDKFSALSTFFSSCVLALAIFFISQFYQRRQEKISNNLQKIDLLEKIIPYLSTKDAMQNKAAILVLSGLGYDTLACNLAGLINSPGTRAALRQLSNDTLNTDKSKRKLYKERWNEVKQQADSIKRKGIPLLNMDGTPLLNDDGTPLLSD